MIIDQKPQTSFIPKKPIGSTASFEQTSVNFFSLIALSIFLVAVLLAGGMYVYQYYLNSHLTSLQASLDLARKQFDPGFITTATRLNARILAAESLLKGHIAPSYIFSDLIEKYTLQDDVQFTNFTWNYDAAGNGTISMSGIARDYTSVAVQAREFASHIQYLKNQIFSNVSLDQNGNVTFSFSGSIDASVVDFKDKRAADLAGASAPADSTQTSQGQTQIATSSPSPFPTGN